MTIWIIICICMATSIFNEMKRKKDMSRTEYEIRKRKKHTNLYKTGAFRRGLALLLAVVMTASVMLNTGFTYVSAQEMTASQTEDEFLKDAESESGEQNILQEYRILEFEDLSEEIQMQTMSVGAKEADIEFPDSLTVTVKEIGTENVGEVSELTLTGIEWKLDPEESDFAEFDGSKSESAYTYMPVLPEVNDDEIPLIPAENVKLPKICVLVGEMQVSLLSDSREYKLDDLPFNNECNVVIDKNNQDQFNNAVLTGEFSDFTDNSGIDRKSSWKGIVIDGVTVDLTIRDVTIDRNKSSDDKLESTEAAITLKNGAALNLTLEGSNYLEGATGGAGICVGAGCTLRITKESNGQLKAVGGDYYGAAAGIGANGDGKIVNQPGIPQSVGNIIIDGGTVEAVGGTYRMYGYLYTSAAGIGGSFEGANGNIEINGGIVTAVGGEQASAIGGGMAGWVSSITITGGTITATRIGTGAAIGAGYLGQQTGDLSCGNIKITDGNVTTEGNIGYGAVFNESSSRAGSVEIGEAVILKCNGNIDPAPEGVAEYNILFTIYDGRFEQNTFGNITMDGTEVARKTAVTVSTPGMAKINAKFRSHPLSGKKNFEIQIDGRTYVADVTITYEKTTYESMVGTILYPTTLEFYDIALTQDLTVDNVTIKQKGTELSAEAYYAPNKISKISQHYGTMTVYLPESNADTDISVTVSEINQGNAIVKTGQSISASEENSILMKKPEGIQIRPEILSVGNAEAKLKVTLNYAGVTLWYMEGDETKPDRKTIQSKGTMVNVSGITQDITVRCQDKQMYHFYMLAQLGGTVSEVVEISFGASPSAEVVLKGEVQGIMYESLAGALVRAEGNPGSTVKLLQDISISETIDIGSQADYTIDLNGKTVTAIYNDELYKTIFSLDRGAVLTMRDSVGGGKVDGDCKYPNVQKLFDLKYSAVLVIQSGIFSEKAGTIGGTAGDLKIEGGTFYNKVNVGYFKYVLTGGKFAGELNSGSTVGNILARGYRYRDLTTGEDVSAEMLRAESIQNVEVYVLPSIGGTVTLTGSGIWDENLTAAYAPEAEQSGKEKYIYTWYYQDENGQETKISGTAQSDQPTASLTSTCRVPEAAVNKWIYCKAEAEGNYYSGSVCSEKMQVLPKNIENNVSHGVIKKYYTGQSVEVTQADLKSKYFRYRGGIYLNLGSEIEIVPDTYRNNTEISTGDSKASVTIRGIGAYTGEYVLKYEILQKDITAEAEASSLAWTAQNVTISAPDGYTICPKTENGYDYENGFAESFMVTEESTSSDGTIISYRLKEDTDGAISSEKHITVKIDKSAPDFGGEEDGIRVENKTWKELLTDISFNFYTKTAEGTIDAADGLSGVAEYYYYVDQVADQASYTPLTKETLDKYAEKASGKFQKAENGKFLLPANEKQVVYAYAVDHAGNRSSYICTEGLVLDTTAPDMQITQPAKEDGALRDTEATIGIELNEDAVLMFFYVWESYFKNTDKYKEYITAVNDYMLNSDPKYPQFLKNENGKWMPMVSEKDPVFDGGRYQYRWKGIQPVKKDKWNLINNAVGVVYRAEGKKGANSIIIDADTIGLMRDTNYTVWIAAVDPAGNITEQQIAFKTAKAMPVMAEPPVVSGVYGDTASELSVTKPGIARYKDEEIKGTWKVTDTGTTLLPMDGSVKCQVTFIPDESYNGNYEAAVFAVTPTLAKCPLVVDVPDLSKVYGEKLPEVTCKIPIMLQDGKTQSLVEGDTEESIQESLRLVTEATKDSPAGKYEFTVTSDSPKYEVTAEYFDTSTSEGASTPKSKGTLTITRAEGKLEKTADFKETQEMRYQHDVDKASFRLGVKANHNEIALHYEVSNATDGNGEVIANENISDQLLAITEDGLVTLKGAGSAEITVSLPECRNYTAAAETVTVQVNITKREVAQQQLKTTALTYGESLSDLDITQMVFTDADDNTVIIPGTIKWKVPDMKPDAGSYEAEYIFEPYDASDSSWKNNYKPYEGTVTVTVNKAKAKLANTPVPGDVVYKPDRALSEFLLNNMAKTYGCVEDVNGNYMAGWWTFKDPEVMMKPLQAGSKSYEIYFEPDPAPAYGNSNYDFSDVKATVTITVKKAIPYVSVPPATNEYTHGDFLYNQNLTEGTVIYGDGKGGPGSGTSGADMSIPGSFTWKDPSTQVSYERSNGAEYEYVFTPDDSTSFETVTGKVTITVNKAEYPPLMPGHILDVAYSCTNVNKVELPQGWEWEEADREKELIVGDKVVATAVYRETDASNYENTSVSIQIIRAACDHAKTEIRNAIKATCAAEGNTGETWCLICKEKLSDGDMIPKDAANHTALDQTVIREATTSAEGLIIQECKACGYSREITIPKLPYKNDDPESGDTSDKQGEKPGSGDTSDKQGEKPGSGDASDKQGKKPGSEEDSDKQNEKPGSDSSRSSDDPVTPTPVSGEAAQVSTLPDDSMEAKADTVKPDKTGEEAEQEQSISDDDHSGTENKTQGADLSGQAEEKEVNSDSGYILFNGYFWILIAIVVIVFAMTGVVYVLWRKREKQKNQH